MSPSKFVVRVANNSFGSTALRVQRFITTGESGSLIME